MREFAAFGIICFLVGSTVVCKADQPVCTGDRHYDGVACCPVVDPPSTTTTTLPGDPAVCGEGCIPVTDIPKCPEVICGGADTMNVVNVTVNRCSDPVLPRYVRCKVVKGKAKKNDVLFRGAYYRCHLPATPKRIFLPLVP